jgi:hypothetical protein
MFDLLSINEGADLASDLNEFNDFYLNEGSMFQAQYAEIERPKNPFHKNF